MDTVAARRHGQRTPTELLWGESSRSHFCSRASRGHVPDTEICKTLCGPTSNGGCTSDRVELKSLSDPMEWPAMKHVARLLTNLSVIEGM